MNLPDPSHVMERLNYCPDTGVFRWKTNRIKSRIGQKTGAIGAGYLRILIEGRLHGAHRLAWVIMRGEWPEGLIDHKNMDTLDNRWENLRPASKSQNAQNTGIRSDNRSGYKGVSWDGGRNKWRADITLPTVRKHLGMFADPVEAHAAYSKAADKYYGQYGRSS